jgi:ABC-type transport system involved in cytochrome c biogenesis permease subunit
VGGQPALLVGLFVGLPVIAWLVGLMHPRGRGGGSPWKYVYSVLVYVACISGIFAATITAYTLFFSRGDLMEVNVLVYLLPVASMVATLVFVSKSVDFEEVPGFDRLSGLMVMIACSF